MFLFSFLMKKGRRGRKWYYLLLTRLPTHQCVEENGIIRYLKRYICHQIIFFHCSLWFWNRELWTNWKCKIKKEERGKGKKYREKNKQLKERNKSSVEKQKEKRKKKKHKKKIWKNSRKRRKFKKKQLPAMKTIKREE